MNSRRRWLATGVAWPALAWTGALRAQANPPVVIGWLIPVGRGGGQGALAFHDGMAALGWKLGSHYLLEERYADGRVDRLPALAQELAAKKPAVIVAWSTSAAKAAAAAAPTTPVVLASGDPLGAGLVTSLARPGGMVTGLSSVSAEMNLKVIELLMDALPKLQRIGFLADTTTLNYSAVVAHARRAAERFQVEAVIVDMAKPEDIEPAFVRLAKEKVQAVVPLAAVWFSAYHPKIIGLALAQRWPVAGTGASIPRQGGLFSYGADPQALLRRTAYYVDRILKGAKPGDLPIEQPTTFDLVLT